MSIMRFLLVWLSGTLLALPAVPCAYQGLGACRTDLNAVSKAQTQADCCQRHAVKSSPSPSRNPRDPCSRECCRVKPLVPARTIAFADRVSAVAAFLGMPPAELGYSSAEAPSNPVPPARSLQILHCLWRC